ncbi:MAG: PilN domain-containing protein [Thermodesulfobacteriota bacterium]
MSKTLVIEVRNDSSFSIAQVRKTPFGIKIGNYRLLDGSEEDIVTGLKGYIHKAGLEEKPLTIGLPRGSIIARSLKIPVRKIEDLRGIMAFEIERHLPFSIDDAYYDFKALNKDGNFWNVIMAAAKKELIDRYMECLKDIPLELTCIDARPFSTFNALSYWNNLSKNKRIAIISFSTDGIELDTFEGHMLIGSRTIPMSEDKWPEWINIIEREIKVYIEEMQPSSDHKGLDQILIVADSRISKDSLNMLEKDTGVPVKIEFPEGHNLPAGLPMSAFGLALRGVGKGDLELNLLPTATFEQEVTSPVPTIVLAIIVILMGIAIGFSASIRDRRILSKLDVAIEGIVPKTDEVKILKKKLKNMQEKLLILEKIKIVPPPLELLKELTEIMPEHTWLTDMDYSGGELSIIGLSDQASSLLPLLEDSDLLEDVEFTGSITTETGGKERFKIKAKVRSEDELKGD